MNLEADKPAPKEPTDVGSKTLMQLGASSATTGPGGPGGLGNPWFRANPTVAFTLAYLDFFNAQRENKSAMAEVMVQQIGITMDLAESAFKLVLDAAEKERDQHITEAVVAGISAAVSLVAAGISAHSLRKSLGKSPEMESAEGEVKAAKAQRDAIETDTQKLQNQQAKAQEQINDNNALGQQASTKPNDPAFKTKAPAQSNDDLNKQMADTQQKIDAKKGELANAEKNLNKKISHYETAERRHLEYYSQLSRVAGEFAQGISKAAESAGAGVKADIAMKKGAINAEQQILQGQQEIMRKVSETISQSYNNSTDAMNQLIQSLKKMEDELIRAMSMTRN